MENVNRRSIEESVGAALSRGDMRQREGPCDLDKVMALGLVGIRERIADAVFRLKYGNDPRSYHDALAGVYSISRSLSQRENWRYRRSRLRWMSKRVLDYWLADLCPACTGLRFEQIIGTPHLSERMCRFCDGSGKRAFPWLRRMPRKPEGRSATRKRVERWRRVTEVLSRYVLRHQTLLYHVERSERALSDKIARRLGRRL